ncbi:hypothetical protein HAX54_018492 [Datura stramonium]|uniref:Uncharacterized protein n=1 Tax=Datura stramonium TaxID=4076 RepID=A0ABS8UPU5_DATST|nr:hypothetical protein [Datura stramonium]
MASQRLFRVWPPCYSSSHGTSVPLRHTSPSAVRGCFVGLGTALGISYFISRAAKTSGSRVEAMEELDASSEK